MSTSDMNKKGLFHAVLWFMAVSLLCLLLGMVYTMFGHGVSSPYMSRFYLVPLLGGAAVSLLLYLLPKAPMPGRVVYNLYCSGLASLAVGMVLRGIFEIAGTSSGYPIWFMDVGAVMCLCSAGVYIAAWGGFRR